MSKTRWLFSTLFLALTSALVLSCAAVYRAPEPAFDISGIVPEQRSNGYVFRIEAMKQIGNVEAWIGQGNWLYITIPDTSVNFMRLHEVGKDPMVVRAQFFRYETSIQVTLQLREKFDHVEVLRYPNDNNAYVVLYQYGSKP